MLAAPFLELLTRRVELAAGGGGEWAEVGFLAGLGRAALQEGKKLLLYLALLALLLLVNLLPGVGTALYAGLAGLVTAWFLALDFVDYPLERRGLRLQAKLAYLRGLGLTGLAFGAAPAGSFLFNLALLPLAAVGGTLLYLEHPGKPPAAG